MDEVGVSDSSPSLQLFKQLGVRPPPTMTVFTGILPVIDVTPKAVVPVSSLLLTEQNLTGTMPSPTLAGRFAHARTAPAAGAALTFDAITGIPAGSKFRVDWRITNNFTLAEAQNAIVQLQDSAGTLVLATWVALMFESKIFEGRSPILEAPYGLKLAMTGTAVAAKNWVAEYGIEVWELR